MDQPQQGSNETLFLCLARDCEANLPRFFAYLRSLRSAGITCRALIGENGSRDQTRDLILASSGDGITLIDTSAMSAALSRLARMAVGRQILLAAAKQQSPVPEFVIIADLDNVMATPPDVSAVLAAMEELRGNPAIFAVGSTSRPVYYDLLALRAPGYDFTKLDADIAAAKRHPLTYHRFHERAIYRHQRAFTRQILEGAHPVLCQSSFNGFAIYRAADYLRGTYRSQDEATVCEHVTLNRHLAVQTGGSILISPELAVQTPPDHQPVGLIRFWLDRIRAGVKR